MAANRTALSTMLRWESMTPLGLPVVPDVYIRVDRASGSAGQWAGPLARASAVAPGDEAAEGTGQDRPGVPLPLAARKLAKVSVRGRDQRAGHGPSPAAGATRTRSRASGKSGRPASWRQRLPSVTRTRVSESARI